MRKLIIFFSLIFFVSCFGTKNNNTQNSASGVALDGYLYLATAFIDVDGDGIQDGDEVLATPLTCTATNFPILANNMKIKWVDVDKRTLNMDLDDLARKITAKRSKKITAAKPKFDMKAATVTAFTSLFSPGLHYHTCRLFLSIRP